MAFFVVSLSSVLTNLLSSEIEPTISGKACGCQDVTLLHEQFETNPNLSFSCPKDRKKTADNTMFPLDIFCANENAANVERSQFAQFDEFGFLGKHRRIHRRPYYHDLRLESLSHQCIRYVIADVSGCGLGHRHGVVAITANLAIEFGFSLALSDNLRDVVSGHGQYPEFREMLGLGHFHYSSELAHLNLTQYEVGSRESFVEDYFTTFRHQCHIAVTAHVGEHTSCRSAYLRLPKFCFDLWPGVYERARRFFQRANPEARVSLFSLLSTCDILECRQARGQC